MTGSEIQNKLDNDGISQIKIKRSEQVQTLKIPKKPPKIGKDQITVDPTVIFIGMSFILERKPNILDLFAYELTTIPTSLFKDNMIRKPNKAEFITTKVNSK